jgi:DNA-binding ferritin-like protein (Dps family)
MNFIDLVTGHDIDRAQATFAATIATLPADYQAAWATISQSLWTHSDFTGRNLIPIMAGIVDLLVETAGEGLSVQDAIGPDPAAFAANVATASGAQDLRGRWRQQLDREVAKAAAEAAAPVTVPEAGLEAIMDSKRAWRAHMARVHALPATYQAVYRAAQKYLFKVATASVDQVLVALVDLLAAGAAAGKPVQAVVGDNPGQFVDDLIVSATI